MKTKLPLIFLIALFVACSNDSNNGTSGNNNDELIILASTNADDPMIASVYSKGDTIFIMGHKNINGFAESISEVIIKGKNDNAATEIRFENNKPKEITAINGVRMIFDWLSIDEAALTLIEPNTGEQLNTIVYFGEKADQNVISSRATSSFKKRSGSATMDVKAIINSTEELVATRSGGVTGNVYLKQCNVPKNAECWVNVYNYSDLSGSYGKGMFRGNFPCKRISEGHYQYTLPQNYHEHHDIADYCDAITNVMGYICEASNALGPAGKQYICLSITAAISSGIVSIPVALLFEAACSGVSVALDLYCNTLGFGPGFGGPSIDGELCKIIRDMDLTWDTPLYIIPVVNAMPSMIYGLAFKYEADGVLRDSYVTWGGKPEILSFALTPPAPVEGQDYTAIAKLYCLTVGTTITMDIVGTDGYSDSKTVVVGDQINYECTLDVPGAETGVKDVCTITIKTLDGSVTSKKASLVFR